VTSGTETPAFGGNLLPRYFLFRSEDVIGDSGSRTGVTIIAFLTANTLDCLVFWSAIIMIIIIIIIINLLRFT